MVRWVLLSPDVKPVKIHIFVFFLHSDIERICQIHFIEAALKRSKLHQYLNKAIKAVFTCDTIHKVTIERSGSQKVGARRHPQAVP